VRGHFHAEPGDDQAVPWLTLATADGVASVRLAGGLARAFAAAGRRAGALDRRTRRGGGGRTLAGRGRARVGRRGACAGSRALAASTCGSSIWWPGTRGTGRCATAVRRLFSREWRTVRWGLVALVALQLLGLNAYAWQQRQALSSKRQAMNSLLQSAHPGVRVVLDAPVQMERETERLRAAAGRPGEADLESMLAAAAAAWPDGQGPVSNLRFEPGKLSMAAAGWAEPQLAQFKERLRAAGFAPNWPTAGS
jgi:general secretion pathway protein L